MSKVMNQFQLVQYISSITNNRCDKQTQTTVKTRSAFVAIYFDTSITKVYSSHCLTINIWQITLYRESFGRMAKHKNFHHWYHICYCRFVMFCLWHHTFSTNFTTWHWSRCLKQLQKGTICWLAFMLHLVYICS